MKKTIFTFCMLAMVLVGCAANGSFRDRDYTAIATFPSKMTQSPAKGSEFEVEPGKSMFSSVRHYVVPGIQLDQDLNHQGRYSNNYDSLVTVPAGVLVASGKDTGGTFYESNQPLLFTYNHLRTRKNSESEQLKGGIYIPTDAAQPPEVYWYWEEALTPSSDPHLGLPYKVVTAERVGKDGFKRELVYSGVSQNTLSIAYREFKDDTERPAYFQDMKYDLSQGNVIAYQGARFQVIKADNTKIRYKVLNTLD